MSMLKKSIALIGFKRFFSFLLTVILSSQFLFSCGEGYAGDPSTEQESTTEENMTKLTTQPFVYPTFFLPDWKTEGVYATGHGTQTYYKAIPEELFLQYEKSLEDSGFPVLQKETLTGQSESGEDRNNYFATYDIGDNILSMSYHSYDRSVYLIRESKEYTRLSLLSKSPSVSVCDTLFTQVGSEDITKITTPGAQYEQESDMCYILRLSDGSFVIFDSAMAPTAERIFGILKKQAPDPNHIVISAWMITHPHSDHYKGFLEFASRYGSDSTIQIKEFLYNFMDATAVSESTVKEQNSIVKAMKNHYPEAKHIYPHTGQVLHYADLKLRILYTQEDYLVENRGKVPNVNGSSIVSRVEREDGADVIIVSDHPVKGSSSSGVWCQNALQNWYGTALRSEVSTVFHHGFGGGATKEIYYTIAPEIVPIKSPIFATSELSSVTKVTCASVSVTS